jgi:hypothetical protein
MILITRKSSPLNPEGRNLEKEPRTGSAHPGRARRAMGRRVWVDKQASFHWRSYHLKGRDLKPGLTYGVQDLPCQTCGSRTTNQDSKTHSITTANHMRNPMLMCYYNGQLVRIRPSAKRNTSHHPMAGRFEK